MQPILRPGTFLEPFCRLPFNAKHYIQQNEQFTLLLQHPFEFSASKQPHGIAIPRILSKKISTHPVLPRKFLFF